MSSHGIPIPLASFSQSQQLEIMTAAYKNGINDGQWTMTRIDEPGTKVRFEFLAGGLRIPFAFEPPCTGVFNREFESCQNCSYARAEKCPHVTFVKEGAKAEDGSIHMMEFER